ncbi:MAG: flippase-like domain-containing protein [Gemmatimonadetes bacterium]|nr:flippase-like domain-containing protein [Gemmatimonadota bacterium]
MKAHALRALRIVVSLGLLVFVFRQAKLDELSTRLVDADFRWLLAALLVNALGNVFGALRWKLLLASQGRRCSTPFLFGSYLVGLFFNNFLPSTIGGDVVRAASARKKGGGTLTEHLTVVLVERMIGLLATLSLGGGAAVTGLAGLVDPTVAWLLGAALAVAVLGLYLALSNGVRHRVLRLLERLPGDLEPAPTRAGDDRPTHGPAGGPSLGIRVLSFVRRTLGKMLAAFELFSRARGVLVANFFLSLGFQFLLIVHFWLIQFAFGESLPFPTYLVVVPLVFCVMMLPIGINGLGVRESAFVWFLSKAGMDPASALAISLASYAIAVVHGLIGGLVHVVRELRGKAADLPDGGPSSPLDT